MVRRRRCPVCHDSTVRRSGASVYAVPVYGAVPESTARSPRPSGWPCCQDSTVRRSGASEYDGRRAVPESTARAACKFREKRESILSVSRLGAVLPPSWMLLLASWDDGLRGRQTRDVVA